MTGEETRIVCVRVTGRVQGVGFRAWTRRQAERRGLAGWVRNERDGSVAALIAGPSEAVAQMLDLLADGPPGARVTDVEVGDSEAEIPRGFVVLR
jgi:acylphosphatase